MFKNKSIIRKPYRIIFLFLLLLPHAGLIAQQNFKVSSSLNEDPVVSTISLIGKAKNRIQAVVYKFEDKDLLRAIKKAHSRGVKIQIIVDAKEAKKKKSLVKLAKEHGVKIRKWPNGKQHAKFAVFDEKVVITGSFNWTKAAKNKNLELILRQKDKVTVDRFVKLFDDLWKRSKGKP